MNKSTALGSALAVLLVFSVFSYAKTFIQAQDQKPVVKPQPVLEVAGQIPETSEESDAPESVPTTPAVKPAGPVEFLVAPETYSATAYSLRGRTASGRYVSRGLIAADPRILPLGTRVHGSRSVERRIPGRRHRRRDQRPDRRHLDAIHPRGLTVWPPQNKADGAFLSC